MLGKLSPATSPETLVPALLQALAKADGALPPSSQALWGRQAIHETRIPETASEERAEIKMQGLIHVIPLIMWHWCSLGNSFQL